MAEETVTIKATVVSDQAVAGFRQATDAAKRFHSELRHSLHQVDQSTQNLGKGLQNITRELGAISGLSRFMGPLAIGVLAKKAVEGTIGVSKSIMELTRVSKELGMSERDIRAWGFTAERAGISAQSMTENLRKFADVSEGLKYNVGGVRNELIRMGAGPVVRELQRTADQAERVKIAFRFKEILNLDDPSGFKGRIWFEQVGLGREAAALSYEQYLKTQEKVAARTEKDKTLAEEMQDKLTNLSITWERVSTKMAVSLFPKLKEDLETAKAAMEFGENFKLKGFPARGDSFTSGRTPGTITPEPNAGTGLDEMNIPRMQHGGISPGGLTMLHANELVVPLGAGNDMLENSEQTLERTTEEGTFQALIRFASHQRAMAGGGGLGSGSVGGGGGGGAGGGSGPAAGSSTGDGRSPGSSVTPSMGEQMAKGRFPMDLQPMYGGGPASWGGITGMSGGGQAEIPGDMGGGPGPTAEITGDMGGASPGSLSIRPSETPSAGAASQRQEALRSVRGSWFGTGDGFHDPSEPAGKLTASGLLNKVPGIALPTRTGLGQMHEVITPDGRRFLLPQIDVGPAAKTRRGIDINAAAARMMGYSSRDFPTDKQFQVGRSGPARPYRYRSVDTSGTGPITPRDPTVSTSDAEKRGETAPQSAPSSGGGLLEAQRQLAAVRKGALDKRLADALRGAGEATGLTARVRSGGQRMPGAPGAPRGASHRHDQGRAADYELVDADGKLVPIDDPRAIQYAYEAARRGVTGGGTGYMGDTISHLDIAGRPYYKGGRRITAFNEAIERGQREFRASGAPPPSVPQTATGDYPTKPRIAGFGLTGQGGIGSDAAIDRANAANRGQAAVNVTVNGKGDKSKQDIPGPEFAPSQVKQTAQMTMTEASQAGTSP